MSTNTAVEVYLGNPIDVASERQFLERLRHDLLEAGVSARILANLHVGTTDRQIDFVVVVSHCVVHIEEKTFPGPIIEGPKNGPWRVQVGEAEVQQRGNPVRQALGAKYALSDELHAFADKTAVPGPRHEKFYADIDTVVCAFPSLPEGSQYDKHRHVTVLGYDELLARLLEPGPSLLWSPEDWDTFGRHLNLYRDDEDAPEGYIRRAGATAVDEYRGRFLQTLGELPPVVPTGVLVDGRPAPRPDLAAELASGRAVLLNGPSELGKTVWAQAVAIDLARVGHVPVWLSAEVCEDSFRQSAARAISPYTSMSPSELCRAADAAGRAVVFVIDDLSKASNSARQGLLAGAQTARVRNPARGLLITAQPADAASSIPNCLNVELAVPDEADRRALLDAYGALDIIDRCDAFVTPLELSLAAVYAGELPTGASATELLDRHVDQLVNGSDRLRGTLRSIARRMHDQLLPSLPRADVARTLRRDHGLHDEDLRALFACRLVTIAHGRISFRHERFEHFLCSEALLLDTDNPQTLAQALNSPRCADLRRDVVALESQEDRLTEILDGCESPDVLVDAAAGRLGSTAAKVTDALLAETLTVACAQTVAPGITFAVGAGALDGHWVIPIERGPAMEARLSAIGRLLRRGRYVEAVARLLRHTDELLAGTRAAAAPTSPHFDDQVFAATYAISGRQALPASTLVHAATERPPLGDGELSQAADVARTLLDTNEASPGTLYVAGHLLRHPFAPPLVADLIVNCVAASRYHLSLLGLQLAEDAAGRLDESARRRVIDAVRSLPDDNLFLNGSIIEALSALGDITPMRSVDDITREIDTVLGMKGHPEGPKLAYGIVSSQFETEAIGPYYEAISELPNADRQRLLAMALVGCDAGAFYADYILNELDDLSDPDARAAVIAFVARAAPSDWLMAQSGMEAVVRALGLLLTAGLPLPEPEAGGSPDPAWRAAMTVILGALDDAAGGQVDRRSVDAAWAALTGPRRDTLASLLFNLHGIPRFGRGDLPDVQELVIANMPSVGVDVLVWSLEHPDRVRSLCRFDYGWRRRVVDVLARRGDRRAADVLRRLVNDPEIGEAAVAAVRAIETRAVT